MRTRSSYLHISVPCLFRLAIILTYYCMQSHSGFVHNSGREMVLGFVWSGLPGWPESFSFVPAKRLQLRGD